MRTIRALRAVGVVAAGALLTAASTLPVERVRIGRLEVLLGETALDSAAAVLGPAEVHQTGDAGTSLRQVCYSLAGGAAKLYLGSSEMGGGERIDGFQLLAANAHAADPDPDWPRATRCGTLSVPVESIVTERGVALGLARAGVEERLGAPTRDSADVSVYEASEAREAAGFHATAFSTLYVRYGGGRVVSLAGYANISD